MAVFSILICPCQKSDKRSYGCAIWYLCKKMHCLLHQGDPPKVVSKHDSCMRSTVFGPSILRKNKIGQGPMSPGVFILIFWLKITIGTINKAPVAVDIPHKAIVARGRTGNKPAGSCAVTFGLLPASYSWGLSLAPASLSAWFFSFMSSPCENEQRKTSLTQSGGSRGSSHAQGSLIAKATGWKRQTDTM